MGRSIFNLNDQLEADVLRVFDNGYDCYLLIDCVLFSKDNEDIKITPWRIETFEIFQDFENNVSDDIRLQAEFSSEEAVLLLTNYENLILSITLNRASNHHFDVYDELDPLKYQYKVMIAGAKDLLKEFNKSELLPEDEDKNDTQLNAHMDRRIPLELQLISEDFYDLRKKKMNGLTKNTTVKDAIYYVTTSLGIKNVSVTEPDSNRTYRNISIPPESSIDNVFDTFQSALGVYGKGLGYYYTDETLYMYPRYDTARPIKQGEKILHLYNLPEDTFVGSGTYYYEDADNVHVICNKASSTENMSEMDAENTGTRIVALRTDTLVDLNVKTEGRKGTYTGDNLINIAVDKNVQATTDAVNVKYVGTKNNVLELASGLCANKYVKLSTHWTLAIPFVLTPGMNVVYHYDDVDGYKSVSGVLSSTQIKITRAGMQGGTVYAGLMRVTARLKAEEEKQKTSTSDFKQLNDTKQNAASTNNYTTEYKKF